MSGRRVNLTVSISLPSLPLSFLAKAQSCGFGGFSVSAVNTWSLGDIAPSHQNHVCSQSSPMGSSEGDLQLPSEVSWQRCPLDRHGLSELLCISWSFLDCAKWDGVGREMLNVHQVMACFFLSCSSWNYIFSSLTAQPSQMRRHLQSQNLELNTCHENRSLDPRWAWVFICYGEMTSSV